MEKNQPTFLKIVKIRDREYLCDKDDFIANNNLPPLTIINDVSQLDRQLGLLTELSKLVKNLVCLNVSKGCYIPDIALKYFERVSVLINFDANPKDIEIFNHVLKNNEVSKPLKRIELNSNYESGSILYCATETKIPINDQLDNYPIIIGGEIVEENKKYTKFLFPLENEQKTIHVHEKYLKAFESLFSKYIQTSELQLQSQNQVRDTKILCYDNLINLCIMVKNAGDDFRRILTENLPFIDRWTILDTGSTDNTIQIINEVLSSKPGSLYCESFINFRDSRNRLFELAGEQCVFNIMLDDTYVLKGNVREFLSLVRSDNFADSFSPYIKTEPLPGFPPIPLSILYSSNRITRSDRKLKYQYVIHEIVENNKNVLIPMEHCYIVDYASPYMNCRTTDRKKNDLELLFKEYEENPSDPRQSYYIAETYLCMNDWNNAFKYYTKRLEYSGGYDEERFDSLYKSGVICNETFNDWERAQNFFLQSYLMMPSRSEGLFMIGNYYIKSNKHLAYTFLRMANEVGYPKTQNMNIKLWIHEKYVPKLLLPLCYEFKNYQLGEECAKKAQNWEKKYLEDTSEVDSWYSVFASLNEITRVSIPLNQLNNPNLKRSIVFVAPGGWDKWDGETLITKGLGGSETFVIKFAEFLASQMSITNSFTDLPTAKYSVTIFCNCGIGKVFRGVNYIPLERFCSYISRTVVDYCFVNREPLYLFPAFEKIKNVYLILHDLLRPFELLKSHENFKGVLTISDWHKNYFEQVFPEFKNISNRVSYGLDLNSFNPVNKKPFSFIYSSFPNRGLVNLLKMFPRIVQRYPEARLSVFCDVNHHFAMKHNPEDMKEIKEQLEIQKETVVNYGWKDYYTLRNHWNESHIWLYPCIFPETCCLTAYEAFASKTFVITNDLAVLPETVGDRGLVINGDARTEKWQNEAFQKLCIVLDNKLEKEYIEKGYKWILEEKIYSKVVKEFEEKYLF